MYDQVYATLYQPTSGIKGLGGRTSHSYQVVIHDDQSDDCIMRFSTTYRIFIFYTLMSHLIKQLPFGLCLIGVAHTHTHGQPGHWQLLHSSHTHYSPLAQAQDGSPRPVLPRRLVKGLHDYSTHSPWDAAPPPAQPPATHTTALNFSSCSRSSTFSSTYTCAFDWYRLPHTASITCLPWSTQLSVGERTRLESASSLLKRSTDNTHYITHSALPLQRTTAYVPHRRTSATASLRLLHYSNHLPIC